MSHSSTAAAADSFQSLIEIMMIMKSADGSVASETLIEDAIIVNEI